MKTKEEQLEDAIYLIESCLDLFDILDSFNWFEESDMNRGVYSELQDECITFMESLNKDNDK